VTQNTPYASLNASIRLLMSSKSPFTTSTPFSINFFAFSDSGFLVTALILKKEFYYKRASNTAPP